MIDAVCSISLSLMSDDVALQFDIATSNEAHFLSICVWLLIPIFGEESTWNEALHSLSSAHKRLGFEQGLLKYFVPVHLTIVHVLR